MSLMECGLAASCGCGVTAPGATPAERSARGVASDDGVDTWVIVVAVVVPVLFIAAAIGGFVYYRRSQAGAEAAAKTPTAPDAMVVGSPKNAAPGRA